MAIKDVKKLENNVKNTEKKINIIDTIFSTVIFGILFVAVVICPLMIH